LVQFMRCCSLSDYRKLHIVHIAFVV